MKMDKLLGFSYTADIVCCHVKEMFYLHIKIPLTGYVGLI